MGILSFLKKIFQEEEKTEPAKEKITLSNIEIFTKKKLEETKEKEKQVISMIDQKITFFTKELKEKVKIVNQVDIELKEKNDKIKSIVYEGRRKYVEFLEKFISNIENIKGTNLEEIAKEINSAFLRFNENSGKSYERATILIGKEMGSIKETLKNISSELLKIFNENKEINSNLKRIYLIESKLNENKEINEKLTKIDEDISSLSKRIEEKEKESKNISKQIEKVEKSSEYLENIEKENNLQLKKGEYEEGISQLRQLIDFKALSNFFHIFPDKMEILKKYKENFIEEFKGGGENTLLNILDESKLNTENINQKIKSIQNKKQEIDDLKKEIKKIDTQSLYSEMERVKENINNLINERGWTEKNKEKMKIQEEGNMNAIKEQLTIMNLSLEN
jgi:hypothetical protein